MANHAAGLSLWFNSNGVTASSPGLLGTSNPGLNPSHSEPQHGSGLPSHKHHWPLAATALRLFLRAALSQGRPCGANLGLEAPNAFGVKNSALRSPPATMDRPVFNAVWYKRNLRCSRSRTLKAVLLRAGSVDSLWGVIEPATAASVEQARGLGWG